MDGGGILGEKDGKVANVETRLKTSPRWVLHGAAMGRHVEFLKIIEAGTYRMHQRGLKKLGGCELPDEEALGTDGVQKKHLRKAGSRVKWQGWWPVPHRSKGVGIRDAERAGCRSPEEGIWGREKREKKMKLRFSVSSVAATWRCLVRPVIAQRASQVERGIGVCSGGPGLGVTATEALVSRQSYVSCHHRSSRAL